MATNTTPPTTLILLWLGRDHNQNFKSTSIKWRSSQWHILQGMVKNEAIEAEMSLLLVDSMDPAPKTLDLTFPIMWPIATFHYKRCFLVSANIFQTKDPHTGFLLQICCHQTQPDNLMTLRLNKAPPQQQKTLYTVFSFPLWQNHSICCFVSFLTL